MRHFLEFEKPIAELEGKIEELRHLSDAGDLNIDMGAASLARCRSGGCQEFPREDFDPRAMGEEVGQQFVGLLARASAAFLHPDQAELFVDPGIRFPKLRVAKNLARKVLGFRYLMDVIGLDAARVTP